MVYYQLASITHTDITTRYNSHSVTNYPYSVRAKIFRQGRNLNALYELFRPIKHTILKRKEHIQRNSKSSYLPRFEFYGLI